MWREEDGIAQSTTLLQLVKNFFIKQMAYGPVGDGCRWIHLTGFSGSFGEVTVYFWTLCLRQRCRDLLPLLLQSGGTADRHLTHTVH